MGKTGTIRLLYLLVIIILIGDIQTSFSQNKSEGEIPYLLNYVSPVPGSSYLSKSTNIILKFKEDIDPKSLNNNLFVVKGDQSGIHRGTVILSDDNRTVLFNLSKPFNSGEVVSVTVFQGISTISGNIFPGINFTFSVSSKVNQIKRYLNLDPDELQALKGSSEYETNNLVNANGLDKSQAGSDLPADFPDLTINASDSTLTGYFYLSNFSGDTNLVYTPYLIILDHNGNPASYKKISNWGMDFTRQPNGLLTYFDRSAGLFYGLDSTFAIVDSFYCGNGYPTDLHELQILPNGHFLLIGDDIETVDMSKIVFGGNPEAQVTGIIIQELDKNKDVIFQWRSWDHFKITDATHENLTSPTIDPFHTNAIDLDTDGNLLISSRHLDEITKINRQTGDIMWRLGGKNNQFSFLNDLIGFSHQHDIRRIANGDITLFDDGNFHTPPFSRAVEYSIDETNMTAKLVWQYRNSPDTYSFAMGSVQRLNNGNTVIGWGATSNPSLTEVRPDGSKAFELALPNNEFTYRAFWFAQVPEKLNSILAFDAAAEDSAVNINLTLVLNQSGTKIFIQRKTDQLNWIDASQLNTNNIISDSVALNYSDNVINNNLKGYVYYRVKEIYPDGSAAYSNQVGVFVNHVPTNYILYNNYPNPFNPATIIKYQLPVDSHVYLVIYNIIGQTVTILADQVQKAGVYEAVWNAKRYSSGVYICSFNTSSVDGKSNYSKAYKMVLLK